jgi:hypothetical protein
MSTLARNALNGCDIYTAPETGAIYIPLPREAWAPAGACVCEHCRRTGATEAFWDTLVIPGGNDRQPTTFTVHMPELQRYSVDIPTWLQRGRII